MNKGDIQNFFEDFSPGQTFHCPTPRQITDADRSLYLAFTGDRLPFYCGLGGHIHPLIVFHTVLAQTVRQISLNAIANLGYASVLWQTPVLAGDEIRTTVEILGLKENSNGASGIAYVRTTGRNQHAKIVLQYDRWVMVRKRSTPETTYRTQPVVPDLEERVHPGNLRVPDLKPYPHEVTGGIHFFEDYLPGERILHRDGMTVNASDHMSFTRLFQNSARVHFDPAAAGGSHLVYGGVVISLGYALSHNGMENRFGIRAINAGSHVQPVRAGDTLYACTDVLECHPVSPDWGAARLRMVVTRNSPLHLDAPITVADPGTGREHHAADVVLDLDYWDLIARRRSG